MTLKSLLQIILKVLGLFFIRDFLAMVPQLLSAISLLFDFSEGIAYSPVLAILLSIAAYGYMAYVLIFKTDWVIGKLKLNEGFEEENFVFNIHRSTVLHLAVIIVGALLALHAIPSLLRQLFLIFQHARSEEGYLNIYPSPDKTLLIIYITELILGLLLLGSRGRVVSYMDLKRRS